MKHLMNSLYVTSEDAYMTLDGENIVISRGKEEIGRYPLHTLENIFSFSYAGASPALMGACCQRNINLAFFTPRGRFLCRASGESQGNVLLRRRQFRIADDANESLRISRNFLFGKIYNCRQNIQRTRRDHALRVDSDALADASGKLREILPQLMEVKSSDILRGYEGTAATIYFNVMDSMILNTDEAFRFTKRNRRPPLDPVNAMLSFSYSLLANDCASALEGVGLDAYVGFLHTDRPGRNSLALDLMEELRPCMADRFVLTYINNRQISSKDFIWQESGAVLLTDDARRAFLKAWQERKRENLTHPYLKEKICWGLIPYVQAQLLTRFLRDDLDGYPPFLWK